MAPKDTAASELGGGSADSLDWELLDSLDPASLDPSEVSRLVPMLLQWEPPSEDEDMGPEKWRNLFKATVGCLGKKVSECNELLVSESELQKQNARLKKSGGKRNKDEVLDDLRATEQELEDLTRQHKDLEREAALEREAKEKEEEKVERLDTEKRLLTQECDGLKEQLHDLRANADSSESHGSGDASEEGGRRLRELEQNVRMKNKQIHQLLEDIEQTEQDSVQYQQKVLELRDELSSATKQIQAMTGEYVAVKDSLESHNALLEGLQSENKRLTCLLEEYYEEKMGREEVLEKARQEIEDQMASLKNVIDTKEATIEELQSRLSKAATTALKTSEDNIASEASSENVALLSQALSERGEQIEELQMRLQEASKELETSSDLIEKWKGGKKSGVDPLQKSLMEVRAELHRTEERCKELEKCVSEAEESAQDKAEEMTEAVARLRRYEKGTFGLEQAVEENEKFKRQLKIRDGQIETLTRDINDFSYKNGELNEEVLVLREKLGIKGTATPGSGQGQSDAEADQSEGSPVYKRPLLRANQEKALMQIMQREIERLEEERIQLKTDNRKLAKKMGTKAANLGLDADDLKAVQDYTEALRQRRLHFASAIESASLEASDGLQRAVMNRHESTILTQRDREEQRLKAKEVQKEMEDLRSKYDGLFEENDKLRVGMQEILDSIRDQDGKSEVKIHSETLDRVMQALDARHLWGDYHPAMGLKSRIEQLDGKNAELRDQIRKARSDEDKALNHAQRLKTRNDQLEQELVLLQEQGICMVEPPASNTGSMLDIKQSVPGTAASTTGGHGLAPLRMPSPGAVVTGGLSSPGVGLMMTANVYGAGGGDGATRLNSHLLQVMNELNNKQEQNRKLQTELTGLHAKVGVSRHQLGLLYEDFAAERKSWQHEQDKKEEEREEVEEKLESTKAKLEEYEEAVNAWETGGDAVLNKLSDSTRRMAILKSNETLMVRRFKAVEESENMLSKDCERLKKELVQVENGLIEKMGNLQRYKDMTSYKLSSLQSQLEDSVPREQLEAANKQFHDLTAKYRDLLQREQLHTVQERRNEEYELNLENIRKEKEVLKEELQSAREKVISMEVVVKTMGGASSELGKEGIQEHQLETLSKQLATIELKELNEKQRADHADAQLKLLRQQHDLVEERNGALEAKFSEVTRANLELQEAERELRDKLVGTVDREEHEKSRARVRSLEDAEMSLHQENDRLKEVSEVARNQIENFDRRQRQENLELDSLRTQVLDLQTQTDEKALVGKLHRQVISLQVKENEYLGRITAMESKLGRLNSQLFRLSKRADEKEELAFQVRARSHIKLRTLHKVISDLRRQYSGAIPLARQEQLSETLAEMNAEKRRAGDLLREAEEKQAEAETRLQELMVKQEGMDELMSTLKQGARTKQVVDWQAKLEDIRLRDLRSSRRAEQWGKEAEHLRDLTRSQARRLEQTEEELVRLQNQMEQRQLDWETRDAELEDLDDGSDDRIKKNLDALDATLEGAAHAPDPDAPLSAQLEQALQGLRAQQRAADVLKASVSEAKKEKEEAVRRLREAEALIMAKERIISDLRLQVPASVDRATALATVTGDPANNLSATLTVDYESKQALSIAQATVTSLRERLEQKETTLARYEGLLKQAREEHAQEMKERQEKIVQAQIELRKTHQSLNELRSHQAVHGVSLGQSAASVGSTTTVIGQQAERIHELGSELEELQASLTDLSGQIAAAKSLADRNGRLAETRSKELEELRESSSIDAQMQKHQQKQESDKLRSEINVLKQENLLLSEDAQNLRESQSKAPSAILKSLVEKLRNDLAEKEKKQRAMSRAITELKQELMNAAEDSVVSQEAKDGGRKMSLEETLTALKKRMEDLQSKNERMSKQVKSYKDREIQAHNQMKNLREDLSKRNSQLMKLKEEKARLLGGSASEGTSSGSRVRFSNVGGTDREKDELRMTVRRLEDRLREVNQAEKPLEDRNSEDASSKVLRNIEEVARWDEKKKWENRVEALKKKLQEADEEVSKLSKSNNGLRSTVTRMEREKLILEGKAKSANRNSASKSHNLRERLEDLESENTKLLEQLESARHRALMGEGQGVETLKLRNKLLEERIETQERKITALELSKKVSGSSPLLLKEIEKMSEKEKDCQRQKHKLEEENLSLKMQLASPRWERCKEVLEEVLESGEILEVKRALEIINEDPAFSKGKAPSSRKTSATPSSKIQKEMRTLTEELKRMRDGNAELLAKVKGRDMRIEELESTIRSQRRGVTSKSKSAVTTSSSDTDPNIPERERSHHHLGSGSGASQYSQENLRQMEADLKRKSDLLSEVKILLKHAAERERAQISDNDSLKTKLRTVLEVDPKTPSEVLAKELRQTRLTVDRLRCEVKELEHRVATEMSSPEAATGGAPRNRRRTSEVSAKE